MEKAGVWETGQGPMAKATGGANVTDPYVRLSINDGQRFHTTTQQNTLEPVWDEEFFFPLKEADKFLTLEVRDDAGGSLEHGLLGRVEFKIRDLEPGVLHTAQRKIHAGDAGDRGELSCTLHLAEDAWQLSTWNNHSKKVVLGKDSSLADLRAKLPKNCEWTYADGGLAGLGALNPLRWSGPLTIENGIISLDREADDQPILLKCPAGIMVAPRRFESREKAIEHLLTLIPKAAEDKSKEIRTRSNPEKGKSLAGAEELFRTRSVPDKNAAQSFKASSKEDLMSFLAD